MNQFNIVNEDSRRRSVSYTVTIEQDCRGVLEVIVHANDLTDSAEDRHRIAQGLRDAAMMIDESAKEQLAGSSFEADVEPFPSEQTFARAYEKKNPVRAGVFYQSLDELAWLGENAPQPVEGTQDSESPVVVEGSHNRVPP